MGLFEFIIFIIGWVAWAALIIIAITLSVVLLYLYVILRYFHVEGEKHDLKKATEKANGL